MINVSQNYLDYIQTGRLPQNRNVSGYIKLKNGKKLEINERNTMINSIAFDNSACSGSSLQIGTACIGQFSFNFITDLYLYDFYDAEVFVKYNTSEDEIILGTFYVADVTRKAKILSIKAYDGMSKLDESIGNKAVNGRPYSILKWCCEKCGIDLGNTEEEINNMCNGDLVINVSQNTYGNYRDVVADLALVLCGFATMGRDNKLYIRQYKVSPVYSMTARERKGQVISEYETYFTKVEATIDSTSYTSVVSGDGLTYTISTNLIDGTDADIQNALDNIIKELSKLKYTPAEISIQYDPRFELGDMIRILADGVIIKKDIYAIITSFNYCFQGANTLKGTGENIFLNKRNKNVASSAANSASATARNNGTYIQLYEGVEDLTIGADWQTIANIEYINGSADCILLFGQFGFLLDLTQTISLAYFKDGIQVGPERHFQTISGQNTLNFYNYFEGIEKNWLSNYEIKCKVASGTLTIPARSIRANLMACIIGTGKFQADNVIEENLSYNYLEDGARLTNNFNDLILEGEKNENSDI